MSLFCPGELKLLLHHHCSPTPFPTPSRLHTDWMLALDGAGLIEFVEGDGHLGIWATTEKGRAYVDMMCNLELPVQKWCAP